MPTRGTVAPSISREVSATPAKAAPAAERPVGQTRRIRIGAPIEGHAAEFRLIGRGSVPSAEATVQRDAPDPGQLTVRRASGPDPEPDSPHESGAESMTAAPVVARSADRSDEPTEPVSPSTGVARVVPDLPVPVTFPPARPRPTVRPLVGRLSVGSSGSTTASEPPSQPSGTPAAGVQREARPPLDAILAGLGGGSAIRPQADTPPIPRSESTSSPTVSTWIPGAQPGPTSADGETSHPPAAPTPTVSRAVADIPEHSAGSARTADPASWQAPIRRVAAPPARSRLLPRLPVARPPRSRHRARR